MPHIAEGLPQVEKKGVGEITSANEAPGAFTAQHSAEMATAIESGATEVAARVAVVEAVMEAAANDSAGNTEEGRGAWEAVASERAVA